MIRKVWLVGACGLVGMMMVCSQAPIEAQGKKDELAKQVQQLKKTLAEREQHIVKLRGDFDAYKVKNPGASKLQKDLDAARQSIKDKDAQIATLQDKSPTA